MNKPSHANPAGADYVGLLAARVAAGHGEVVARLQPTVSDGGRDYAHVSRRDFRQSRAETGSPQTASTASQSRQRADIVSEFDPVRAPSPLRFPLGGCAGYAIDCVRGGIGGPAIAATDRGSRDDTRARVPLLSRAAISAGATPGERLGLRGEQDGALRRREICPAVVTLHHGSSGTPHDRPAPRKPDGAWSGSSHCCPAGRKASGVFFAQARS